MTTPESEGNGGSEPTIPDLHLPAGPPPGAPLDADLALERDRQAAAAEHAAGMHSAESLLNVNGPLPYVLQILRETWVRMADALASRNAADTIGSGLVESVVRGDVVRPAGANESPAQQKLRTMSLPAVVAHWKLAANRITALKKEETRYNEYLTGAETDATGVRLIATVPTVSHRRWWWVKLLKKAAFLPFDIGILFFTLRYVTRTEVGGDQVLQESIETVGLVGLSALILLVAPTVLADAIFRTRVFLKADGSQRANGTRGAWAAVIALGSIGIGLVVLVAWLRASYLAGGVDSESELQLSFGFFFMLSLVWLLAPGVIICLDVLHCNYSNTYVPKVMRLREELIELEVQRADADTEIELRNASIRLQEEWRRMALDEHDSGRTITLPRSAAYRRDAYFEELARLKGDPYFTEAVVAHREAVVDDDSSLFADPLADLIEKWAALEKKRESRVARRDAAGNWTMASGSHEHRDDDIANDPDGTAVA